MTYEQEMLLRQITQGDTSDVERYVEGVKSRAHEHGLEAVVVGANDKPPYIEFHFKGRINDK